MKKLLLAAASLAVLSTASLISLTALADETVSIMVPMKSVEGADLGYIKIEETNNGVIIQARMENIATGWHGFHIHEVGSCADSFKAAKGHYNPEQVTHGIGHGNERHGGDLPNIYADENGKIRSDAFTKLVTLVSGKLIIYNQVLRDPKFLLGLKSVFLTDYRSLQFLERFFLQSLRIRHVKAALSKVL